MDQWQHIINNAYSALLGSYNSAIAKQEKGTVLDKVNAELLKNLIYNPATKQVFPQSPLHEKDPEKLAMNLVVGMAEPIKEKTPLTADWDTAVDIVRGAGTKGQASLDDIMKAVDTVKAEMGRQMTPEELAKNKSIDRAIDMIQPRVEAEMGGKLPKQLPKELEGLAAEARKYNSAEEFGQSLLYHGTDSKNTASILNKGLIGSKGRYGSKGSIYVSTTDNPTLANYFGDDVIALKKEGLKFLDIKDYARPKYIGRLKDVPEDIRPFIAEIQGSQQGELALGSPAFQKFLKSKGYNGIVMDTADALQKEGVSFGREYRVIGNVPKENIIGSIKSPEGFVKESFSSDIFNQSKGGVK